MMLVLGEEVSDASKERRSSRQSYPAGNFTGSCRGMKWIENELAHARGRLTIFSDKN